MNELRRNYVFDQWVIIAEGRGRRPHEFSGRKREKGDAAGCFFCPGSEGKTPPEIGRVEEKGRWIIRTFPNKFAATASEWGRMKSSLLSSMPAYGKHEVIVETPDHDKCLGDLPVKHIARLLDVYAGRIIENRRDMKIKYVLVFKNHGAEAGTSLAHSHSQVISLPMVPSSVQDEVDASRRYMREKKRCVFCDIRKKEMKGGRRIVEDEHVAAFAPFASRFSFEAWIMPKRHVGSLELLDPKERLALAGTLKKLIAGLNRSLNYPPYNFYLHVAPGKEDFHFHLELCPRVSKWAGFELGSGFVINTMSPELAAKHYRQVISRK